MSEIDMTVASPTGADVCSDKEALKQKVVAAKDAMADLAREAKQYASNRVSDGKDTAARWVETTKEKASDMNDQVVDFIQRKPFQAIGIAIGIGFVAGLILKRR